MSAIFITKLFFFLFIFRPILLDWNSNNNHNNFIYKDFTMATYSEMMEQLKKSAEENNLPSVARSNIIETKLAKIIVNNFDKTLASDIEQNNIGKKSTEVLFTVDSFVNPTDSDIYFRRTLTELNRIAKDFNASGLQIVSPAISFPISNEIAIRLRGMSNVLNRFLMITEIPGEPTRVSEHELKYKIGKSRNGDYLTGVPLEQLVSSRSYYGHKSLRLIHEPFDYVYLSRSARHPKADFKKKPLERINGKKEIKPSKFLLNMVKKVK